MAITFDDEDITPTSTITFDDEIADQPKATSSITFDDEIEKKSTITFDDEVAPEEPSAGDIIKGVGVEVGAGVGGSVIGGIIGGTLGSVIPGAGTAAGAVIGASIGGAAASFFGSLLAQDIEGQEDKSMGRAIAAAAIGAVPGGVGKGIRGSMTLGKVATREAAKGAAFGVTDATARAVIDEGRLPTPGELAQFGGAGALFGGALGGVTTKIGQKFAGKTPQQIDDAIAREEITFSDLSFFPKQASDDLKIGEGLLLRGIQETKDGARSRASAQALTQPQANLGTMGKILASVAPSKFVGTKAQQATIDFSRIIKTAEEISGRIGAKTARAIKKDPSLEAPINKFLDTGEMSDDVARVLGPDLTKYNEARVALQKEAIQLIDDGAYKSLDQKARQKLRDTIDDSMNSSQRYARREYEAFLNPNYKPTKQQEQAARNELASSFIAKGDDNETAFAKANKKIETLKEGFASEFKDSSKGGSNIDSIFRKRKNPGKAEREWLGEVRDPVERMRGTLTGVARSVAREKTNDILTRELIKSGIAFPSQVDGNMIKIALRGMPKEKSGLYAYPQVQTALNELYVGNGSEKMDNIFLNGLQDLYRAGVGLSKGVKVLLNTVAYPVQVYGNTANLLGMGINPFSNVPRGLRLALADVPLISRALEGLENTPKARKALLDELEEMSKYGIKNANILESDIRSTLDSGPFSKWLQKGLDPFGKAYQTADTMGRYVGWKANQNTIEKIFPGVSDEAKKKMAAMMINDTYQNYDKLSNVVRTLSRWGVMPQFASFTAEFARNQYNQGKMIARMLAGNFGQEFSTELGEANVKQMRSIGIKRLASLLGVYGATYAGIEGVKAASGVDDKKEEALRDVVYAPWDKNRNQLVKLDKGGRTGWVANPSYVVPHALGLSALQAGLNGDSEQSVIGLMAEELVGDGSFIFQEAYQALANRDERGELISEQVDELDQARERLTFFLTESFRPGFSRELKKIQKARLGKGDLTLKEAGARQLGARINPFDVGEAATFTVRNTNTLSNKAKSRYTSLLKFGDASEAELNEVYNRSNEIYSDAFVALSKNNESLSALGYNENERIKIFKDGGISSKRILEILTNSPSDLPRTSKQSTSEIYGEMGETMQEKRSNIMKSMRTDPQTGKRLMSMWVREKRNASKGLNQRDTLMRNMDTDEKVDYLSKNPGMINEFRRKNMLSNEVLRALRIKGSL